ncbi:hypothetical protein WICPIJ_007031 [Wickerhamomyces pijperi]|uniref:Uncharacterized protein n=1 Tax=Wickerhamomyces pijperi TaxID=599730 RepID=A0A9P8Q3B4_WICPI|nr:hypothetical protein WICPIJ_007031 [Wickerhamomyces pijperi]
MGVLVSAIAVSINCNSSLANCSIKRGTAEFLFCFVWNPSWINSGDLLKMESFEGFREFLGVGFLLESESSAINTGIMFNLPMKNSPALLLLFSFLDISCAVVAVAVAVAGFSSDSCFKFCINSKLSSSLSCCGAFSRYEWGILFLSSNQTKASSLLLSITLMSTKSSSMAMCKRSKVFCTVSAVDLISSKSVVLSAALSLSLANSFSINPIIPAVSQLRYPKI